MTLRISSNGPVALDGRVINPRGLGVAGASIRVEERALGDPKGADVLQLTTDLEGWFESPVRFRRDREYRATIVAEGCRPLTTGWLGPDRAGRIDAVFRDLKLEPVRVAGPR